MKTNAKKLKIGKAQTGGYKSIQHYAFRQPRDMPLFSFRWIREMLYDSTIRLGLAMRNAPLLSAEFAYQEKGSEEWTTGVQANSPVIGAFVERQFKRIWQHHLTGLLQAQVWGWAAGEVVLKKSSAQVIEVDSILTRRAEDTFPLTRCGELAGVRFLHVEDAPEGRCDIEFPNAIWHRFRPEPGTFHSESVLLGAFSAWCDKWLDGGALDVRRLFMHKDAYGGCVLEYPEGITPVDMGNGTIKEIPNRDIAREIVEQIKAGGVVTLPSDIDPVTKQNRWKFTPAHVAANPAHILLYPKDLDTEMLRGMEIPDDIFTADADTSGAWAGKQVPLMAFYAGEEIWLRQLVRDIDQQIVRPLVTLNYGPGQWYEVTTKPLALQAMEQQGSGKGEQPAPQQPQVVQQPRPLNMSLEAVGQGVIDASVIVSAAKAAAKPRRKRKEQAVA